MGAYIVILATLGVPEPSHEVCCQRSCLLLIDLFQYVPYSLYVLLALDAREGSARDTGTDDLLDGSLFFLPMIGVLQSSDFTLVLVCHRWGVMVDVIIYSLRL